MMLTLDEYMAWDWAPKARVLDDGTWALSVPVLPGFAVYGESQEEVMEHYPEMLRSHLNAFVRRGAVVPVPQAHWDTGSSSSSRGASVSTKWNIFGGIARETQPA